MSSDRDRKYMLCGYCQNMTTAANSKCDGCEFNPGLRDCFELGSDARKMMAEGVLTRSGAVSVVYKLNSSRFEHISKVFEEVIDEEAAEMG